MLPYPRAQARGRHSTFLLLHASFKVNISHVMISTPYAVFELHVHTNGAADSVARPTMDTVAANSTSQVSYGAGATL